MQWLPLSRHTAQTSLGTTRFFLSIHLPHLSCIIPCSYWALTWVAVLPTCMTSYEISVRQTRDLPVSWYIPHIQLPSDSISRWTPLPSAISFPLPGGFGTLTLKKRAPPGALSKRTHEKTLVFSHALFYYHTGYSLIIKFCYQNTLLPFHSRNQPPHTCYSHLRQKSVQVRLLPPRRTVLHQLQEYILYMV